MPLQRKHQTMTLYHRVSQLCCCPLWLLVIMFFLLCVICFYVLYVSRFLTWLVNKEEIKPFMPLKGTWTTCTPFLVMDSEELVKPPYIYLHRVLYARMLCLHSSHGWTKFSYMFVSINQPCSINKWQLINLTTNNQLRETNLLII